MSWRLPRLTTGETAPLAELAPCTRSSAPLADPARVANDPHHAPAATGCRDLPRSRRPPRRPSPGRRERRPVEKRERRFIEPPKEPSPNRDAHGPATRFAPHKTISQRKRAAGVATDDDPSPPLDGDHYMKKRSCSRSLRDAESVPRRRSTSRGRCCEFTPLARARGQTRLDRPAPTGTRTHSESRSRLARPSCPAMSPPPSRPSSRGSHRLTRRSMPHPARMAVKPPSPSPPRATGWSPRTASRRPSNTGSDVLSESRDT
jgi:hypothetical protein